MHAKRLVDATNLRALGQARLAIESEGEPLSSEALTDVYAYAVALSRFGGINEPKFWYSAVDPMARSFQWPDTIVSPDNKAKIEPRFQGAPLAVAVALLPRVASLPGTTPIMWTRGLQSDGTWRKDAPFGDLGGNIFFAAGTVSKYRSIDGKLTAWGTGKPTSNIREALPPDTRIGEYVPTQEDIRRGEELRRHEEWLHDFKFAVSMLISLLLLFGCSLLATVKVNAAEDVMIRWMGIVLGVPCAIWFWSVVLP